MHENTNLLCSFIGNRSKYYTVCDDEYELFHTDVQKYLCDRLDDSKKVRVANFSINRSKQSGKQLTILDKNRRSSIILTTRQYEQRCHRGLLLRVWLNVDQNLTTKTCLCPPSFYGDMCQYQNQRVSLTLNFQAYSDFRRTLFALIILLIDDSNQRIIHSYQQLTYLYIQYCQIKLNFYLLYSTRPKHSTKHYSIHIDIYEKISFIYHGSFFKSLIFDFLPVYHQQCIHGQYVKYLDNSKDISFCQCNRGWSGKYCTISHICTCSSDSLCIRVSANNRSICICPLHKLGSQCLLDNSICNSDQNTTCYNNG
ncbi:unnamed protein product [Rotaria sp. Silwood1]|nr:unnamed protein product [Rotaria sp. Silwood1]